MIEHITDSQILTITIAVVFPIVAVIYSQVASKDRFGDLIQSMNHRFDAIDKRFDTLEKHTDAKIDNAFAHMEMLLKIHELEHHKK